MVAADLAQGLLARFRARRRPAPPAASALSYLLIGASLFVVTAMILFAMARAPVCHCQHFSVWNWDVTGPENSQHLTDWYSALHVLYGLLCFAIMWRTSRHWPNGWLLIVAIIAGAGWEIAENTPYVINRFGQSVTGALYRGDSIPNALADMLFMLGGFLLAMRLPALWSIAVGIAIEVVVAIAVQDSLLIGTLMLIHPIRSIAIWQTSV